MLQTDWMRNDGRIALQDVTITSTVHASVAESLKLT